MQIDARARAPRIASVVGLQYSADLRSDGTSDALKSAAARPMHSYTRAHMIAEVADLSCAGDEQKTPLQRARVACKRIEGPIVGACQRGEKLILYAIETPPLASPLGSC